jgi:mannose-6-phosphate isomerase-like protein (cupin superfamily)
MQPIYYPDPKPINRQRYEGGKYLFRGESCYILSTLVPGHCSAYPHHVHEYSDQIYYVTSGEMHVQLGPDVHVVGPDTVVFIPLGLPHHNWNEGDEPEHHLEIFAPPPLPTQPLVTRTDSVDGAAFDYLIREADPGSYLPASTAGFSMNRVLQGSDGSQHLSLFVGAVEPASAGPATHIHAFDQFYFILEGELTVQIALDTYVAPRHSLVRIPAGVPHSQWNADNERERHVNLLAPTPKTGEPFDTLVRLEKLGHVG